MKAYEYDIAISLCKQDVEFAKDLVVNLNPGISRFFYEYNQEQILTQSGPEVFGRIFKEKSRIVVILARAEWSESFYTEIEKNAIIDRTSKDGYNFLVVIPMESHSVPVWYPNTRIYVDPKKFSLEQIARFIEFKITDEGGAVKPITLEDRYSQLQSRISAKKKLTSLQETMEAIDAAKDQIKALKAVFNQKMQIFQRDAFTGSSYFLFSEHVSRAYFQLGKFKLDCTISDLEQEGVRVVTTQDYELTLVLSKIIDQEAKPIAGQRYLFLYSGNLDGWAIPSKEQQWGKNDLSILFRNRNSRTYYDLRQPISSADLTDLWFQELLKVSAANVEKYL